jgi:Double-GTPase 1
MAESTASLSVLGLPGSGKTTFLAALWDTLSTPNEIEDTLTLARLPEEREYLTGIRERWLQCLPTPKTRTGEGVRHVEIDLRRPNGSELLVHVPDIAGEAFAALWEQRTWTDDLRRASAAAEGLAVFIHANNIEPARPIAAMLKGRSPVRGEGEDVEPPNKWDPRTAPTQVKLVDLLQAAYGTDAGRVSLPLAIVLSAWDTVAPEDVTPSDYLALQLPMLSQFLCSRVDLFPHCIFGVSAQGGDVTVEAEAERLRAIDPPSHRVVVVDNDDTGHDIARPIQWLLEAVQA